MRFNIISGKKKAAAVALLLSLTIVAVAVQHNMVVTKSPEKNVAAKKRTKKHKLDPEVLGKLQAVISKIVSSKIYSFSGSITAIDKADTSEVLRSIPLVMFQGENQTYYRMGEMENIKDEGLSLSVDHNIKKILLSSREGEAAPSGGNLMNLNTISEALQSEKYDLRSASNGGEQTISLVNEQHVTCKEYSITYNVNTLLPSRIYTRLTNLDDPSRKDNEKVIEVKVSNWNSRLHMSNYTRAASIVTKVNGEWKATGKYEGYTIIEL